MKNESQRNLQINNKNQNMIWAEKGKNKDPLRNESQMMEKM